MAIEIHIRGMTQDLNEIELNKHDGDVTAETILKLESSLGIPYVRLAEMFHDNEHVKRECYLTAFSLRPQKEIFEHVRRCRIIREDENEYNVDNMKSIECTHVVVGATSSISKVYCKYCGNYRNADDEDLPKSCEILLNTETLANVPANFHSDLIILVQSVRIKQLSWSMPWYELEMNCQKLMIEERKLELTTNQLVNANDQLQYIDLDYSMFRHLPEADVPGIEKGYEQYVISSDSESEEEDEEEQKSVKVKDEPGLKSAEKKNYTQYFESSDDSDRDFPLFGQRQKKGKRRSGGRVSTKVNDANYSPVRRTVRTGPRVYIDKSKTHLPPKKRLHRSLKKKFEFDYNNSHARFYITCRKAQLDIKKQRVRLLHKRDGKHFYNFLAESQIQKPINEDLVRKNVYKLSLMNRNRYSKSEKERIEEKPKLGRQAKQKLVFSSGAVALVGHNGCVMHEQGVKRKRPKSNSLPVGNVDNSLEEIIPNPDAPSTQEKLPVKRKRPPRPKSVAAEPILGPDGQPIPVARKKRPARPKSVAVQPIIGPDGQPLPPVKRKRPPRPSRPKSVPAEPIIGPDGQPLPPVKKKRPPRPKSVPAEAVIGPDGQPLPPVKKKRPPRPKSAVQEPLIGPDGQPLPMMVKKRRPAKPKTGPDGLPLPPVPKQPVRRPKPKKSIEPPVLEPEYDPSHAISESLEQQSVLDPSKYEAAEILAQLGTGPFGGIDPDALINHQEVTTTPVMSVQTILKTMLDSKAKLPIDRKVLTEQNGVNDDTSSEGSGSKKARGRPKGVKNKIKLDVDGNPLPKPPRKPHKSRKSSELSSISSSEASIRDSISSVASGATEIKEEPRQSVIVCNSTSDVATTMTLVNHNHIEDNPIQLYDEPVLDTSSTSVDMDKPQIVELPPIDLTQAEDEAQYSVIQPLKRQSIGRGFITETVIGDDGIPLEIIKKAPKRKSCDMVMGPNGEVMKVKEELKSDENGAKKLIVMGLDGVRKTVNATKCK